MRDIRHDLAERIKEEERKREPLARTLAQIDAAIDGYRQLLEREEVRFSTPRDPVSISVNLRPPAKPTLQDFLLSKISHVPISLDHLKEMAEVAGYSFDNGQSPGRVIHGALLNPLRSGAILRTKDGRYYGATKFAVRPALSDLALLQPALPENLSELAGPIWRRD